MSLWTRPHRAPTRPGRRAGVAAAVFVVLVAILGTLAVVVLRGGEPVPTMTGAGQGSATGADPEVGSSVARALPEAPPAAGVVLPAGTATVEGYQVGFPASDLGAVAAAVEITRAQVGFDYEQAAAVARAYAAPDDLEVLTTRARAAVGYRRHQLGVARTGDVAAPAGFALIPFAFQALEVDSRCYAVTVLSLASTTTVRGGIGTAYYAGTQFIRWVDHDWKAVAGSTAQRRQLLSRQPLAAVGPSDPRFRRAGWVSITTPEVSR